MSTDCPSSMFTPSANRTPLTTTPTPQTATLCPCDSPGSSHHPQSSPQSEESCSVSFNAAQQERDSTTYRQRRAAAEPCRRHSVDGGTVVLDQDSNSGSGDADRFHPYRRQFSDGGVSTGCLSPGLICLREVEAPEGFAAIHTPTSEDPTSWYPYNGSFQASRLMRFSSKQQGSQPSYPEPPAAPEEPSCYLSESHASYSTLSPLQQLSTGVYSTGGQSTSSLYSLQSHSTLSHQDSLQSLFPKPIYSYSILIFMALKNSKTGSLPTAPDGWKNSVRHNLSLNKCFEKVENKTGNSSRKGCLWALNPAKVEKMQEELHKWRRKDPLTVRKSMARPEDLDRLLGERPDKLKFLNSYHCPTPSARCSTNCHPTSSFAPSQPHELPVPPQRCPIYPHGSTPSLTVNQQPRYLSPASPHSFSFYSPCVQQPQSGIPSNVGTLGSPLVGQTPPSYSASLQADYGAGHRGMQELQLEVEASNDIDTLNPSLTDLQLHGYLWEELREDSLAPDSLVVISPSPASSQPIHLLLGSNLRSAGPVNQTSEVIAVKVGNDDEVDLEMGSGSGGPADLLVDGLYHTAYTGVESLAGYLATSVGNNPIPLL
ncbi:hypothetical protein UPYG_G00199420 [Umbra pygmaea]|uniref:Fork-head domain-containing protein n=1 Tax=Umbra pygmaea TaxID=75934 RepID=A0ABD0WHV8_UMBPY